MSRKWVNALRPQSFGITLFVVNRVETKRVKNLKFMICVFDVGTKSTYRGGGRHQHIQVCSDIFGWTTASRYNWLSGIVVLVDLRLKVEL